MRKHGGKLLSSGLSTCITTATGLPQLMPNPCAGAVADLESVLSENMQLHVGICRERTGFEN